MSLFTNSTDMDTTGDKPNDNDIPHLTNIALATLHKAQYAQQLCTQAIDDLTAESAQAHLVENDTRFTRAHGLYNHRAQPITTDVLVEWQWAFTYNDNQLIFTRPQAFVLDLRHFLELKRNTLQNIIAFLEGFVHGPRWRTVHNVLAAVNQNNPDIDKIITWAKRITNTATQNTQRIRNTLETIDNVD